MREDREGDGERGCYYPGRVGHSEAGLHAGGALSVWGNRPELHPGQELGTVCVCVCVR